MAEVQSPTELASRLFSKPPSLQNLSLDSSPLLNSPVSSLEEGAVRDLLAAEMCTTTSDQKQFNAHVSTGSLLHLLAFVGRNDAVQWLLKNGAFVHSQNHAGSTPLHVAAIRHHAEMIRTLRYYHADPYCENKDGKTALDFGQEGDDVKEALLSHRFAGEELEDEYLQDRLPPLVDRVTSSRNHDDLVQTLLCLRAEIRTSTSSMTSVPKPLKFLRDKFDVLKEAFDGISEPQPRALLSDVLSVLAITVEDKESLCLKCRLSGTGERISSFGHPYISRICTQIPGEWQERTDAEATLLPLVHSIVVYCLDHSSESEAADLLMEIDRVSLLKELVKEDTYQRLCLYLTSCVKYVPEPEDSILLHTALDIYQQFQQYPHALRLAMMLNDITLVKKLFLGCSDRLVRKQLAFMLGRQQVFLELEEQNEDVGMEEGNGGGVERSGDTEAAEEMEQNGVEDAEDLTEIMSNVHLNNNFLALARELDIMEPKVPEDIYKTHLEHVRFSTASQVDSAQGNLASSFVNGFVNCGFCVDKLLTEDGNKWIYKNKGVGMLSATASLGLVLLWDVEGGLTEIDKFLYSNEEAIKAGALLACGIVNCGVRNECDPALALLSDYTQHKSNQLRCTALVGMGLAYAGSAREDVLAAISPGIWDEVAGPEVISLASLSSGLVAVGTGHGELTETLVQAMHEKEPSDMTSSWYRFLALGLALVHLGKQEGASLTKEALNVVAEPLRTFAITLLDVCAYTGTGSVLKIQQLLHVCSESHKPGEGEEGGKEGEGEGEGGKAGEADGKAAGKTKEAKDKAEASKGEAGSLFEPGSHQALAVLGIALIAMGEDIGAEMAHRIYSQLLHYGEPVIRRAVPLALALLSTSHPQLPIIDTLHKFSHDSDPTVARNAIFSMGLVGSGTNNARLASMLRNLAQFYHKEPSDLFVVRLAQGLTHLGKGTLTLNPYHSDRMLISPVAVAALLIVMVTMLDASNIVLKDAHYMLFYLTPAIQPRMLVTFDEELNPLPVTVRVGQAVDVVGQAGKPKAITGFQTHKTPVLLAYGERAELATDEYIPLTPILEGFVILKKNPDSEQ